ncbi:MAG: hypothetical protein K6G42_07850 [Lachnospiraceae bacterium]|nr:hypothetical protein [Lachnospiraceae bacterium]
MNSSDGKTPVRSALPILIAVLVVADYFLFRGFELVWPFFWMPYIVMLILYLFSFFRSTHKSRIELAYYSLIYIPVLAGFTMSLAWMLKIRFWSEMLGTIINP